MLIVRPGLDPDRVRAHRVREEAVRTPEPDVPGDGCPAAASSLVCSALGAVLLVGGIAWGNGVTALLALPPLFVGLVGASRVARGAARRGRPPRARYEPRSDFVTGDMLTDAERDIALALADDVATVLDTPLPRPHGDLLDRQRDRVVLRDVLWRIALELLALSDAARNLDGVAATGPEASRAKARAIRALDARRTRVRERAAVVAAYAEEVRAVARRVRDLDEAARIDRIAAELLAAPDGAEQDAALASLEPLRAAARAVAELHGELA
ncbi:hypothetical protein BJF83_08085 [Nocardiopsis sp. CNR-923]|uniref:hypothetical protein n=1 Tax=Nocardiopsis sp. CNR-923 TaxID=1904965 RepID=UPI00096845CE|nr:hypothetical protein [Nocardiopsis sp. CNR-923]OLT30648.1 hypothetical protein BJF83_08085 [Nocardiopsis sp. CNR-923]